MRGLFALGLAASLGFASPVWAEGGAALVIGNADYDHAPDAVTAERDAEAVGEALEAAGWRVTKGVDLDRFAMRRTISRFAETLDGAESVLIYYSGHALRSGGASYLAPTDAQAETLTDVLFDGVPLDLLLRTASGAAGKAVVFLDGAQLKGFAPTDFVEPGLADLEGPDGVLIVSAAEPGHAIRRSRWRDSRFARLIVDRFLAPGAAVMATATGAGAPTFISGTVDDDFALIAAPEPVHDTSSLQAEIELAYWRAAERTGSAADYQAYLKRYPEGTFSEFARQRLGIRDETAATPEDPKVDPVIQAERDLNLSRIRKRQVQTWLLALGHDPNGVDGLFGRGSRKAIAAWQRKSGFDVTTYLTADQLDRLGKEGDVALAEQRRIAEEQRRIAEAEDNAYWSATGAKATPAGYRAYLEKYPEGLNAKIARAAMAKIAEAEADDQARKERKVFRRAKKADTAEAYRDYLGTYPEGIYRDEALARLDTIEEAERTALELERFERGEAALALSEQDRLSIEQRLRAIGFEPGRLDGVFDNRTRSAIKGYQASRDIEDTGYLERKTVVTLVRETNQPQAQQGRVVIDGAQVIRGLMDAIAGGQSQN